MLILGVFAVICFILGIIFIRDKEDLKKIEGLLNKPVIRAGDFTKHNKALGVVLLVLGAALLFVAWTIKR